MPERAFYPAFPVSVVAEIEETAKRFAATELKVAPTREDARPGQIGFAIPALRHA
jgi:hypothetical protein